MMTGADAQTVTPMTITVSKTAEGVPRLALRPREAARALGISERLLWTKTNAGEIPHLRLGRAVVYPVDGLRDWLARLSKEHRG